MIKSSSMFSKYLSDDEMVKICSEEKTIEKMLQFETALAITQAKLNIIPHEAATEINHELNQIKIAPEDLAEGTLKNGVPVLSLLSIAKEVEGEW